MRHITDGSLAPNLLARFNRHIKTNPDQRAEAKPEMGTLLKKYRNHRAAVRDARELELAIRNAPSRSVRDELLTAAQQAGRF